MNGSDQSAELHAGHGVLHTLKGFVGSWPVVKKQQDSGANLDHEEEGSDSAEKISVGQLVDRDGFLLHGADQICPMKPIIQPIADVCYWPQVSLRAFG